jgi:hypothetical protein
MKGRRKIRLIEGNAKCSHLKLTCTGTLGQKSLDFCYSQSPPPADITPPPPPVAFLDLRFLQQQLKVGGGMALLTQSGKKKQDPDPG